MTVSQTWIRNNCWPGKNCRQPCLRIGIQICEAADLTPADLNWLDDYTTRELMPVLTPIAVDPTHPFPFIRNRSYALALDLKRLADGRELVGLLLIPDALTKFISLPEGADGQLRYIHIYDAILAASQQIFPGFEVGEAGAFQIVRDGDLDIEEEAEDLVRSFESAIKRRQRGQVIQLTVDQAVGPRLKTFLADQFNISQNAVTIAPGLVDFTQVGEIVKADLPAHKFEPFHPRFPERVRDFEGDCFAAIEAKDFVVHHPFESFDVVVQFLSQASKDPDVLSIKQTLYRTSNNSPLCGPCARLQSGGSLLPPWLS